MTAEMRPRRIRECSFRPVGDEGGLVVLPGRAEVKVLKPAAMTIFGLLDGEHTKEQIVDAVVDEFDVEREQARVDLDWFLNQLEEHGMIETESTSRSEENAT